MLNLNKKTQSALEFLTTYAWAFLAILVVLSAITYFGIFDFSKFLPEKCVFSSQFKCEEFVFNDNNVRIKLINNLGEKINVDAGDLTIVSSSGPPLTCTVDPAVITDWEGGNEEDITFGGCSGTSYKSKERFGAKVTLEYYSVNTAGAPKHKVVGRLDGKVQ